MKPKKVKAEDCVNGNCEMCDAAGMPLDHRLMNAYTSGGLPGVVKEYGGILAKHHLPREPGIVLELRWMARNDEWWLRTVEGWFWLDRRADQWIQAPLGPPS